MEEATSIPAERTGKAAVSTLAFSMLLAALGTSIANIALPAIGTAFATPFYKVQWVIIAYLLTLTIFVVIAGRLGDRFGLKRVLLAGLGLFVTASILCGLAPSLAALITARSLQGIAAAILTTLAMALMRETAKTQEMGRAMGLLGTASALGTALGPSLGGVMISAWGWRSIFLLQAPLAGLALITAILWLPRDVHGLKAQPGKLLGSLNKEIASNLAANVLVASMMMTTLVVGPFYLAVGMGLNESMVGLVMAVGPVISIISGLPSGRIVDAWGAERILLLGLVLLAIGSLLLAFLPDMIGITGYVLSITVLTPGYQLFQAANNTAVLARVPEDRRGLTSGLLGLARNAGLILGASGMSSVFALGIGTGNFAQAQPAAIAHGMRLTFLLGFALMLIALGLARRFRPGMEMGH